MPTKLLYFCFFYEMGCICSKKNKETSPVAQPQAYSWEVRRSLNFDVRDYIIENVDGRELIRRPGTVNGQQMVVQNCKNAVIFILDHCNTVTLDDCVGSTVILGAVKSSVFVRNCTGCTCITACGQFRARDSRKCNIYIHCETQPIIEASTKMKFGDFFLSYTGLEAQLRDSSLNTLRKSWVEVHDFTPVEGENNWAFIDKNWSGGYKFLVKSDDMLNELDALEVKWKGNRPTIVQLESSV